MAETNLQTFTHNIYGTVTALEINGEAFFKAKDASEMLGYADTDQAIRKIVADEDKFTLEQLVGNNPVSGTGLLKNMHPHTIFVNESGLNDLILDSKKPQAKTIRRWVTKDILPSIRKTGSYMHHMHPQDNISCTSKISTTLQDIAKAHTNLANKYLELAEIWEQEKGTVNTTTQQALVPKPDMHPTPEIQFLTSWWDCIDHRDVTAKDLHRIINNQQCPKLQQAAIELFGPVDTWTNRKLGNILRSWSHQEFKEYVVINLGKNKAGTIWRLEHK